MAPLCARLVLRSEEGWLRMRKLLSSRREVRSCRREFFLMDEKEMVSGKAPSHRARVAKGSGKREVFDTSNCRLPARLATAAIMLPTRELCGRACRWTSSRGS